MSKTSPALGAPAAQSPRPEERPTAGEIPSPETHQAPQVFRGKAWLRGLHCLFSMALALTLVAFALIPLHASQTVALGFTFTEGERFFSIAKPAGFELHPGDELPLFRYTESFQGELGRARILEVKERQIRCELVMESFRLPLGHHGVVEQREQDRFLVQLGREHGFQPGTTLNVFEAYRLIAQLGVTLPFVNGSASLAKITRVKQRGDDLFYQDPELSKGLAVSEYPVITTVAQTSGHAWLPVFEICAILGVVALDLHLFFRRGIGLIAFLGRSGLRRARAWPGVTSLLFSLLLLLGLKSAVVQGLTALDMGPALPDWAPWGIAGFLYFIQLAICGIRKRPTDLIGITLAGPLYWFIGTFAVHLVTWPALLKWLAQVHFPARLPGAELLDSAAQAWATVTVPSGLGLGLGTLLFLCHWAWLLLHNEALPWRLWQWGVGRPGWIERLLVRDFRVQRTLTWGLHLAVFWVFAHGLVRVLTATVNQTIRYLAPATAAVRFEPAQLGSWGSLVRWSRDTQYNISVLAEQGLGQPTFGQCLEAAHLAVLAFAMVGCLWGYFHSVVRIFHFSTIRNVDFSLLGWCVNALGSPLALGSIFWTTVPLPYGVAPTVAQGPLYLLLLLLHLLFTVLYAAAVWNMGSRYGVMVDKGLVDRGFFAVIRHPIYTLEALMLIVGFGRSLGSGAEGWIDSAWVGAALALVVYWLRSERDEAFMAASNPGYAAYRERVPYKFIRGFW